MRRKVVKLVSGRPGTTYKKRETASHFYILSNNERTIENIVNIHIKWSMVNLPAIDEDLAVVLDGVCEDPQWSSLELLLLLRLPLLRGHLCLACHSDSDKQTKRLDSLCTMAPSQAPFS